MNEEAHTYELVIFINLLILLLFGF